MQRRRIRQAVAPRSRAGQMILEGVLLWVIVAVVLIGMAVFFQRAVRGRFFQTANQVGEQFTPGQKYTIESRFASSRDETTNTQTLIGNQVVSESRIRQYLPGNTTDTTAFIGKVGGVLDKITTGTRTGYPQAEVQVEDYLKQDASMLADGDADKLGKHDHGVMPSGQLSKGLLFLEDKQETPAKKP